MIIPLHCHSTFSTLDGLSKPWQIAARTRHIGANACAITDHGNIAGAISFMKALKDACKTCGFQPNHHSDGGKGRCVIKGVTCHAYDKDPIKPIAGLEFYLCQQDPKLREKTNRQLSHLVVLAKNLEGWKGLIKASSESNKPEHFYHRPRLNLEMLAGFAGGNFVTFSGHPGSDMADVCFVDYKAAYACRTVDAVKGYVKSQSDLKRDVLGLATKYRDLFGRDNFFLEIQKLDQENFPAAVVISNILRWASKQLGIPCVATPDAHYCNKEDAADQRVLLCSAVDTTLAEAERKLQAGEDIGLGGFFRSNRFHIPNEAELREVGHTDEELNNTLLISDMCEVYDVFSKPRLPQFDCPDGLSADDYLKVLLRDGWKKKVSGVIPKDKHGEYADRVKEELGVLCTAGLSPYFLIVHDYCQYAHNVLKCKRARGRGSAAGCLISHLLNITDCDPIKYKLSFSRFYNAGRNDVAAGKFSLPDIDTDFPSGKRDEVIAYVRKKYGEDHVCQMATFSELQGREALTCVLRAHGWGSFEERKRITAMLPDKSSITDELQQMMEDYGEASIIKWALDNESEELSKYCEVAEDGSLSGPLATYFAQAMRIEGCKKHQGRHPSGVLISPVVISDYCPMLYDKGTGRSVAGFEMGPVEAIGFPKFDFLSTRVLNKITDACSFARTGKVMHQELAAEDEI